MPRFISLQHNSIWRHLAIPMALLSLALMLSACGGGGSSGNRNASSSPTYKTLTAQAVEPAGSNCEFGGLADLTGKDTNRNGVLDSNEADPAKTLYTCNQTGALTLGGTVTGLPGDGSQSVTLQNLGMDDQMMTLDGNYLFNTAFAEGSTYQATVASQPNARQCEFADYSESVSGTLGATNITDLNLTCYEDRQVITFAGSSQGYANGTGTAAKFRLPKKIAVSPSGSIFLADTSNNRIRKITPGGVVSTFAGSSSGYTDGTGAAAKFSEPAGIAVDESGNLYVADSQNHRIRKITPDGVVSTLAGSAVGHADGTGSAAQFRAPQGIAIDESSNLYVADSQNHRIRKITPAGVVTTLAGSSSGYADGTGAAAKFYQPTDIAIDENGNLYIADTFTNRIRKITPDGVVSTFAGSTNGYVDGSGSAAKFSQPQGIAIDESRNLYVADSNNHLIRKITPAGVVSTVAGSSAGTANGTGTAAKFSQPRGIAVDENGNLYVADTDNNRIRKIYQVP